MVYTVHAYRFGDRELHSYSVGVYSDQRDALSDAEAEREYRGGKYECEVLEWELGNINKDGRQGVPYKVIKGLPQQNKLHDNQPKGTTL